MKKILLIVALSMATVGCQSSNKLFYIEQCKAPFSNPPSSWAQAAEREPAWAAGFEVCANKVKHVNETLSEMSFSSKLSD